MASPTYNHVAHMKDQKPDQRRSARFRFHVDVDVCDRGGLRRGRAIDVARHGLFISIVEPPRNRHLVQLVIHLPYGPVQAAATVSRSLAGEGVGLALFALSEDAKRRWDSFILEVQQQEQRMVAQRPLAATTTAAPIFLLRLGTVARLLEFLSAHVSGGGTVLFTPVLLAPGSPITLVVVHPVSDEEYSLHGRVHRCVLSPPKRLEILFSSIDQRAFAQFVSTGRRQTGVLGLDAQGPAGVSTPTALIPVSALDLDDDGGNFNIDVLDEEMGDDPIAWDLRNSDLPPFVGTGVSTGTLSTTQGGLESHRRSSPKTDHRHGRVDDPVHVGVGVDVGVDVDVGVGVDVDVDVAVAVDVDVDVAVAVAVAVDVDVDVGDGRDLGERIAKSAPDPLTPGLHPTRLSVSCDGCTHESYVVELGRCAGPLGLIADLLPFWSNQGERVVSVPRVVDACARRERFARYVAHSGDAENMTPLATVLLAADLAEPATDPASGAALTATHRVEGMALAAERIQHGDVAVATTVKCPHCPRGHLVVQPA